MDNGFDWVLVKHLAERRVVSNVGLNKGDPVTTKLGDPFDGLGAGVAKVVDNNDGVALFKKRYRSVAADIASTTGYENCA